MKPHLPFVAPKKYWDLYDPSTLPMPTVTSAPKNAPSIARTSFGELRNYSDMPSKGVIDEATTRHLIHGYYAATSYADAQIGRVLDALDESGLADNTIVVLWGDHGWHLGDHGLWCKHTNYEQAARIPVIVAVPGGRQGESTEAMIETVDIYPTLAELAGVTVVKALDGSKALAGPEDFDGRSFASLVMGDSETARDHVTHVYPRGGKLGRAIRDPRYRMVEWKKPGDAPETAEIELYDYQLDPLETENVAQANSKIVAKMRVILNEKGEARPQFPKR